MIWANDCGSAVVRASLFPIAKTLRFNPWSTTSIMRLGNYGKTIDIEQPSRQRQGNDAEVAQLLDDLKAGKVSALFVAGTDLTHNLPDREELAKAIAKCRWWLALPNELTISRRSLILCVPIITRSKSWMDAEPVSGLVSLSQPTLQPLGQTRSILESLNRWMGQPTTRLRMRSSPTGNRRFCRVPKHRSRSSVLGSSRA